MENNRKIIFSEDQSKYVSRFEPIESIGDFTSNNSDEDKDYQNLKTKIQDVSPILK